jgi:glycosyltransferase involved in cell wall biosynthesis
VRLAILGARGIPARYGGFETFAERVGIGLHDQGVDVTVFCEAGGSSMPALWQGVNLRYVPAPSLGPLKTILYDARCLWAARKGYDIVYMLGYGAAPFCLIPRIWGTEVWINPDGLEWARAKWGILAKNYFRMMEWATMRVANRVIADAESIAASLASRHGKSSKCTVIAYGGDVIDNPPSLDLLVRWSITPGNYYLVVSRLEPENHVLEIVEGFEASHSSLPLLILGNIERPNTYVRTLLAKKSERIRFLGTVFDLEQLTALRYHAKVYLHGHSVGGTNPSLLEAMACSNLVIAHDNPFNREVLDGGGLFFQSVMELKDHIDAIDAGKVDCDELRAAASSRLRKRYRWDQIVDAYLELLSDKPKSPVSS